MKKIFESLKIKMTAVLCMVFLSVTVGLPLSMTLKPEPVEAGALGIVHDPKNAVINGINAAANTSLNIKETILDPIFYAAAKIFLRQMVASIVNWINSGFQGSPAFLTDFSGFLRSVADATIGEFIYNDPSLNFLCSPFKLDVKIALATQYSANRAGNYQPQCTLSQVAGNVEGFLQGDFSQGGWGGLVEMTQNPVNTPVGAYLSAQNEAYVRIIDNQGREVKLLEFGEGFFSLCKNGTVKSESGSKTSCAEIVTPGTVFANSINKALGAGQDELISADEINEIFSALFAQLMQKAITGIYGLLGLGGNSGYSNPGGSYLDAIIDEAGSTTVDSFGGTSPIVSSLNTERDFLEYQTEIVARIDAAEADYENAEDDVGPSCSLPDFPSELTQARTDATTAVNTSTNVIGILNTLLTALDNAEDVNDQISVYTEYNRLSGLGLFHTDADLVDVQYKLEYELKTTIDEWEAELDEAVDDC